MQSHKATEAKPRLPWGFGSAARHGKVWWFIYRSVDGEMQYENSRTGDVAEAQKLLAQRAIPRAKNMLEALERIANGEPYEFESEAGLRSSKPRDYRDRKAKRKPAKKGTAGRNRRGTAKNSRRGTGSKATPNGGQK